MIRQWLERFFRPNRAPSRIQILGRWYKLVSVGGPVWQHELDPNGPLTYTYYPEHTEDPEDECCPWPGTNRCCQEQRGGDDG